MAITEDRKEGGVYELGYLILPSVAEEDLPKAVEKLKDIVKKAGGQELDGEEPFKIDLAYEMSKIVGARKYVANDAYIGWFKFEVESAKVPEINEKVQKLDEVLRALLIKTSKETRFTFADARKREADRVEALEAAQEALENPKEDKVVE